MADDPLYQALGTRPIAAARPNRRGFMVAGAVVLMILALAGYAVLQQGRHPTESVAIVPIEPLAPAIGVAASPPPVAPIATDAASNGPTIQPNGDTVEYQHGVKIIRLGGASLSKSIAVPGDKPSAGAARPAPPHPAPAP